MTTDNFEIVYISLLLAASGPAEYSTIYPELEPISDY